MKKFALIISLGMLSWSASAQKTQKLYHSNGKLAFEGKFTMAWTETEPFEYLNPIVPTTKARQEKEKNIRESPEAIYDYQDILPRKLFEGVCKFYFLDGTLMAEGKYVNGIKNGDFKLYHNNGKLSATQSYVNGMANGLWKSWDEFGNQTTAFNYKPIPENLMEEFAQYFSVELSGNSMYKQKSNSIYMSLFPNWELVELFKPASKNPVLKYQKQNTNALVQKLRQVKFYSKAYKEGSFTFWDKNQLALQMHFKNNKPEGKWTMYENAKPIFEMEIKNDSVIYAKDFLNSENNYGTREYKARFKKDEEQRLAYEKEVSSFDLAGLSNLPSGTGSQETISENKIFRMVEENATPAYNWQAYVDKNLKYPPQALKDSIEGRVTVEFVVERDGFITSVRVIRGKELGKAITEEAIRVVRSAPKWKPGQQNGKPVRSYITIPITFKLP